MAIKSGNIDILVILKCHISKPFITYLYLGLLWQLLYLNIFSAY